jgi:hypothetical protein
MQLLFQAVRAIFTKEKHSELQGTVQKLIAIADFELQKFGRSVSKNELAMTTQIRKQIRLICG